MGRLKSIKHKSVAFLMGLAVLAMVILLNIFLSSVSLRLDLTQDQEYTLSSSTHQTLKGLTQEVTLKLYFSKQTPTRIQPVIDQVEDLIDEFVVASNGKLKVEHINPDDSPQKEQEVQMMGIPPLQINVVEKDKAEVRKVYLGMGVFFGDKKEILPVVSEPTHLEYDLTSILLRLTSTKEVKLGLLNTTTSPEEFSFFDGILNKQINVEALSTVDSGWVGKNLDALLILDPKNLPPNVIKEIDAVWNKGIPVMVFGGGLEVGGALITESYMLGLEDWLKQKGVELVPSLVIDPRYTGRATFSSGIVQYQVPYPFFVNVPKAGLNANQIITQKLEGVLLPWTSSFKLNSVEELTYQPLIESSDASFLQEGDPNVSPQALENLSIPNGAKQPLAVLVTSKDQSKKLLAVANAAFLKNTFLNDFEGNALFVQNMIDWATRGDTLIGIRSRGKTLRPLAVLSSQSSEAMRWFYIVFTPLIFIALGFMIRRWHNRKLAQLASKII